MSRDWLLMPPLPRHTRQPSDSFIYLDVSRDLMTVHHTKFQNQSDNWLNIIGGKTCNKEWTNGGPIEWGGARLDKYIVNIIENYINYIQSNPKLVLSVEYLSVADIGMTGHYLTCNSPCSNNNKRDTSAPQPDAKWRNHWIQKHRTPELPTLTVSCQTRTSFYRAQEGPDVHQDLLRAWL